MGRKAQAWYADIVIGTMIFLIAFAIFMKADVNLKSGNDDLISEMTADANYLADTLLSQGIPPGWTAADVIVPGILTDNRVDEGKLGELKNMSYPAARGLLRVRYDYIFYFMNRSGVVPVDGDLYIGKEKVTPDNITVAENPAQILRVVRLVVRDSQIMRLEVLMWQ